MRKTGYVMVISDGSAGVCSSDLGKPIFYDADRFGFNNPDVDYQRAAEILVLGDSFVEGICLEPGKDLAGQLRRQSPGTIGIGSRGSGPLFELAMLGRYGPHLRPKSVVMAFFEGNDWENLDDELKQPYLRQALARAARFGSPTLPAAT